jgi:cell division protein ZapA
MNDAKKKVTVRIMDRDYTLRSGDDPEYLRSLGAYVDGKMRGILRGAVNVPLADAAILAAVNIADELHRSRRKLAETSSSDSTKARTARGAASRDVAELEAVHQRIQSILDLFPK